MDDLKKSQESMGAAATGVKKQVSETAADAKEKLNLRRRQRSRQRRHPNRCPLRRAHYRHRG
jgi:hypothetical protein